jgi:hypothetical protein
MTHETKNCTLDLELAILTHCRLNAKTEFLQIANSGNSVAVMV